MRAVRALSCARPRAAFNGRRGDREGLLKLYHFPSSPHCLKVRAVAYELGVQLALANPRQASPQQILDLFRSIW